MLLLPLSGWWSGSISPRHGSFLRFGDAHPLRCDTATCKVEGCVSTCLFEVDLPAAIGIYFLHEVLELLFVHRDAHLFQQLLRSHAIN